MTYANLLVLVYFIMSEINDKEAENKESVLLEIFNRLEKKLDFIIQSLGRLEGDDSTEDEDDDEDEDVGEDEEVPRQARSFVPTQYWKRSNGFTHPGPCKRVGRGRGYQPY